MVSLERGNENMSVRMELTFESHNHAVRVLDAIAPDNYPLPTGIMIDTQVNGPILLILIKCERGIDSLRATLEDIMSAIDLSIRTYKSINCE
ncbi:MAG: CTAG/PCC1 family protein [Candidatus Thorarchaeota archaeon]